MNINDLFGLIEEERMKYRSPLFIVGAGVSIGRSPLMNEIFQYFCDLKDLPQSIRSDVQKLYKNKHYQSRSIASNFFGILQTSKEKEIQKIWNNFTKDFLEGKIGNIGEKSHTPLWKLHPSYFHIKIAEQVVQENLPASKIANQWRIRKSKLDQWIDRKKDFN